MLPAGRVKTAVRSIVREPGTLMNAPIRRPSTMNIRYHEAEFETSKHQLAICAAPPHIYITDPVGSSRRCGVSDTATKLLKD